jgi:alpha-beta hydrolase superfamily lysophospholipase
MFHDVGGGGARTGVVLSPQFGWEAMCSHRPRRAWAERLASAGLPVLRIDHAATGDSSGTPGDPDLLGAWTAGVDAAVRWLRDGAGCSRVAVIGLELGGLVAVRAVASGTPADDLVLWNVPAGGRTLVRALRAFGRFEHAPPAPPELGPDADLPAGSQIAGGYVMTAATLADLGALDLTSPAPALPDDLRVLLLGRDDLPVDPALATTLQDAGAIVDVLPGPGYSAMTAEPTEAVPPLDTADAVTAWLRAAPPGPPATVSGSAPVARDTLDLLGARETPVAIRQPCGELFGILTEPTGDRADLCAVLLNAGALTHAGPNRMWVEAARRWAQQGVPSLRLDLEGIGESDGDETAYTDVGAFYTEALVPQVLAALDDLARRGLPQRFVLLGLCSGAYWAFHAALRDERVAAAYLVNPRALLWDDEVRSLQQVRKLRKLARPSTWRKVLDGNQSTTRPSVIARAAAELAVTRARSLPARVAGRPDPAVHGYDRCFDALDAGGARALFLFTGDEPLHDELVRGGEVERLAHWPSIDLHVVARTDQTHTLRPYWCQREVHGLLDAALAQDLRG